MIDPELGSIVISTTLAYESELTITAILPKSVTFGPKIQSQLKDLGLNAWIYHRQFKLSLKPAPWPKRRGLMKFLFEEVKYSN